MAERRQCPYFGECGGCRHQDLDYAEQLAGKAAAVGEWLGELWPAPVPVAPSPSLWHYRNKMEFSFGRRQYSEPPPPGFLRESVLGLKRRGRWYWTLDLEECLIAPEGTGRLLQAVRAWFRNHDLRACDSRSGDGVLRHLVIRAGQRTGERLVVLLSRPGALPVDAFVTAVHSVWPGASVLHGVYEGKADAAYADETTTLAGDPWLTEELVIADGADTRSLRFRISPFSFFQNNTPATELLYAQLREWVRDAAPGCLFDLYGGSGGIAFTCADLVPRVRSVENCAPASDDGRCNAAINGIDNVTFLTADVKNFVRQEAEQPSADPADSVAILDPPRAALHPKVLSRLVTWGPAEILYVSCNPKLMARELPALLPAYELAALCAFDLFPHTPHVEAVARLRRRPTLS